MKMNFLTKSLLAFSSLFFLFSCGPSKPVFELITAAEKQQSIEAMELSDPQKYWNYEVPDMDQVLVGQETYRDELVFDIYYPPSFDFKQSIPVIIVANVSYNSEIVTMMGKPVRDFRSNFSLAQVLAASGMAVVQYDADSPINDSEKIIQYIIDNNKQLCIDSNNIGLWGSSRNAYLTLKFSSDTETRELFTPRCIVLYYPVFTGTYYIPDDVPILMVKAGEFSGKNSINIDKFLRRSESEGVLLEYIFYEAGEPDFEYKRDTEESRKVIDRTIAFLHENLGINN